MEEIAGTKVVFYQPLQDSEFRLLVLKPAKSPATKPVAELWCVGMHSKPSYEALSYTWGDTSVRKPMTLCSQPFSILENLDAALRSLRHAKKDRVLWVDAICVNQEDLDERRQQVQQMRTIYEQAQRVVIWLGEPGQGGRAGAKRLKHFSNWREHALKANRELGYPIRSRDHSNSVARLQTSDLLVEQEYGEVSELLDRPWWKRVWIVQEVVFAKQVAIRCGPDEVPWERVRNRMQKLHAWRFTEMSPPESRFPDAQFTILDELRSSWHANTFTKTLYELLYESRRFGCTDARDRIYAFLGLACDSGSIDVTPDYSITTCVVYQKLPLTLIQSHQSLLILNLKRAYHDDSCIKQQSDVYSIADQAKFHDTEARIRDYAQAEERRSWVRLPEGWERLHQNGVTTFINHRTGTRQQQSPIAHHGPVRQQDIASQRSLPPGWIKHWDNLGRVRLKYAPNGLSGPSRGIDTIDLPSWVPNWAEWSLRDPQPLVDWPDSGPQRYLASGVDPIQRDVPIHTEAFPNTLVLQGVLSDEIALIAPPWHPKPTTYKFNPSRKGHPVLETWEEIALRPVATCPYSIKEISRFEALWRTQITDYVGSQAAPAEDGAYFVVWLDPIGWGPPETKVDRNLSIWRAAGMPVRSMDTWVAGYRLFLEASGKTQGIRDSLKHMVTFQDKYREYRECIHSVCKNRALFVTKKGYIGLAPWNAIVGDSVCVLYGGETPFLLRKVEGSDTFTLVGESYVYGIMNGEALQANKEMSGAMERDFCLV